MANRKYNKTLTCSHCGKQYKHWRVNKFCSYECYLLHRTYVKIEKTCSYCRKTYYVIPSLDNKTKFCSRECRIRSESFGTVDLICDNCGKSFNRKREKVRGFHSFCCHSCQLHFNRGSNHYEWKEDIRKLYHPYALEQWSIIIKKRDNYTCQLCGETDRELLESHHIKCKNDFPELALNFDNGITLCLDCHLLQHVNDLRATNLIKCTIKKKKKG